VQILLPHYGAEVVCGQDEEGRTIDWARAEHRAGLLENSAVPEAGPCLAVIRQILSVRRAG